VRSHDPDFEEFYNSDPDMKALIDDYNANTRVVKLNELEVKKYFQFVALT
jgi:hypothetical protein